MHAVQAGTDPIPSRHPTLTSHPLPQPFVTVLSKNIKGELYCEMVAVKEKHDASKLFYACCNTADQLVGVQGSVNCLFVTYHVNCPCEYVVISIQFAPPVI